MLKTIYRNITSLGGLCLFYVLVVCLTLVMNIPNAQMKTVQKRAVRISLSRRIDHLLTPFQKYANLGIIIQSMHNGKIIYKKNADHFFVPASMLKLFTATASLLYFGPDFHFSTILFAEKKPDALGLIRGNLLLHFDADPTLTQDDLEALIIHLKKNNVSEITGNLYLDNTQFDQVFYGPGWMWDELNLCYAAPLSSIIIDKNCFYFYLAPGADVGVPAELVGLQSGQLISVMSTVLTQKTSKKCKLYLEASNRNSYYLQGCVKLNSQPKEMSLAIKNVDLYAKSLVKSLLNKYGIKLHGRVILGKPDQVPSKSLVTHYSLPLSFVLSDMLKNSDNMIADALYKKLATSYYHKPATWADGKRAIRAVLADKANIDFEHMSVVDGAGLSRYNLVTPRQLSKLLYYIYHTPDVAKFILPALPKAGIDGTLEKRMTNIAKLKDHDILVRAKTGSMTGVSGLAGYVKTKEGTVLSFVISINGFLKHDKKYQHLEDNLVMMLLKLNKL